MKIDRKREFQPAPVNMSRESNVERYLENRATPERLRKGNDFRVFEGVQKLNGPLAALHRSGDIDDGHVAAAERWYRDYVLGVEGARDPSAAAIWQQTQNVVASAVSSYINALAVGQALRFSRLAGLAYDATLDVINVVSITLNGTNSDLGGEATSVVRSQSVTVTAG